MRHHNHTHTQHHNHEPSQTCLALIAFASPIPNCAAHKSGSRSPSSKAYSQTLHRADHIPHSHHSRPPLYALIASTPYSSPVRPQTGPQRPRNTIAAQPQPQPSPLPQARTASHPTRPLSRPAQSRNGRKTHARRHATHRHHCTVAKVSFPPSAEPSEISTHPMATRARHLARLESSTTKQNSRPLFPLR